MPHQEIFPALKIGDANPRARLRNAPAIYRMMMRTMELPSGCWEWMGARNPKGYGNMRRDMGGPVYSVHRISWEHFRGKIPSHLEIDHICLNRACVNPDHLRLVTRAENVRYGRVNQNHGKVACKRGHKFDSSNTRLAKNGKRVCRLCQRDAMRTYRARGK